MDKLRLPIFDPLQFALVTPIINPLRLHFATALPSDWTSSMKRTIMFAVLFSQIKNAEKCWQVFCRDGSEKYRFSNKS